MRGKILLSAVFLNFCLVFAVQAAEPVGLLTGPKTGTYYAFGKEIAAAAAKSGLAVEAKASEGSIDNIKRINNKNTKENATLGIVQSDVLGFLSRSKNPDSIRMANNLRMVFPFYNEEVHVLARKEIKDFSALSGKKIAIGEEGSGSMLTAINLFSMMGVTPGETQKIPSAQGVAAVLKGELDAVLFVGGKPVRLFKNLEDLTLPENQRYAAMLEQVYFLPLDDAKMLEEYMPAEIRPADYRFVKETVQTIAVRAMLISRDLSKSGKTRCAQMETLNRALHNALPELKEKGHPKWKEVDLDAAIGQWKRDSCAWSVSSAKAKPAASGLKEDLIQVIEQGKTP